MSERYWITGVQLGLLISIEEKIERQRTIHKIIENQFIGNFHTDAEKKHFIEEIEGVFK